jgi:hypothetical protein
MGACELSCTALRDGAFLCSIDHRACQHCGVQGNCILLYYSARDWGMLYAAGDGTVQADSEGVYRHIGVATLETGAETRGPRL